MKENMLCGVHIGEHSFDADAVINEINERVVKPGYNFVTIRTRASSGEFLPKETYIKWARFCARIRSTLYSSILSRLIRYSADRGGR